MQNNSRIYEKKAYGKINLYLDVLNRRNDGYHNIRSVMQTVSLCDTVRLEISPSTETKIEIECSDKSIRCDKSNLVYKAAEAFLTKSGGVCMNYKFYIEKNIPVSAGMAGGSSDAAAALHLLNEACGFPFDSDELCHIGGKIGADVPFCIIGGTCICEEIGEKLTRLPAFSDFYLVSAIGSSSVSTPVAFSLLDEKFGTECTDSSSIDGIVNYIKCRDFNGVCSSLYNKFEQVIFETNPDSKYIKELMIKFGAKGALMSGSGPSVFGFYETEEKALYAVELLKSYKIRANICKTI